jgi:hypothetical protein
MCAYFKTIGLRRSVAYTELSLLHYWRIERCFALSPDQFHRISKRLHYAK